MNDISEITKKRQSQIDKCERLKSKLNAVAVNVVNDQYNISFGSHAERYSERDADRILDKKDSFVGESEYRTQQTVVQETIKEEPVKEKPVTEKIKGNVGVPVQTEPEIVQQETRQEVLQGFRDSKTVQEETDQDAEKETKKKKEVTPRSISGKKKSGIKVPSKVKGKTGKKRTGKPSVKFGKNL